MRRFENSDNNVFGTPQDPVSDWTFTIRAPAALDHGFTHISLTEFALDVTDRAQLAAAMTGREQRCGIVQELLGWWAALEYAELTTTTPWPPW